MINEPVSDNKSPEISHKKENTGLFLMFVTVMLMVTIAALMPLPPNDFFPYVRIGEEIAATGSIPTTEFMTYTQFGKPVEYAYWLPSLIFMWIFNLGGVTLTTIVVMLCIAAYFVLLWFCLQELEISPVLAVGLIFIFGLTGGSYYIARPQIFAFPLFGLTLLILIKWLKSGDRLLWLLPLVTVFWVNVHGSFIIQFFLLIPALIFGSGNRKKLLIVTLVALAATLINYYGFGIWKSIFSVVGNESNRLYSLEFQKPINEGWQANIQFATYLVIPVLTALLKPRIKLVYWIWFLGFGWMAFTGIRYGIWYLSIITILIGCTLDPFTRAHVFKERRYFQNQKLNLIIGILLILIPVVTLPGIRGLWWKVGRPVYSKSPPIEAVEWLQKNPQLPGEIWSDFDSSTYLTYALPERKLFMTNRMDDFPVEQYEEYLSIFHGRYNWESILDKYNINLLLFNFSEQPIFMDAITASPLWKEIYRDERFVIYEHKS